MAKKTNQQKSAILELGKDGDFWKVICEFLDESIERIEQDKTDALELLKEMPAEQFKVKLLVLEARRNLIDDLKNYPNNLVRYLSEKKPVEENYDPYFKSFGRV